MERLEIRQISLLPSRLPRSGAILCCCDSGGTGRFRDQRPQELGLHCRFMGDPAGSYRFEREPVKSIRYLTWAHGL